MIAATLPKIRWCSSRSRRFPLVAVIQNRASGIPVVGFLRHRWRARKQAIAELDFQFVFYTGSTKVGRLVEKSLAGKLVPTVLELGGKSPCVIHRPKSLPSRLSSADGEVFQWANLF